MAAWRGVKILLERPEAARDKVYEAASGIVAARLRGGVRRWRVAPRRRVPGRASPCLAGPSRTRGVLSIAPAFPAFRCDNLDFRKKSATLDFPRLLI